MTDTSVAAAGRGASNVTIAAPGTGARLVRTRVQVSIFPMSLHRGCHSPRRRRMPAAGAFVTFTTPCRPARPKGARPMSRTTDLGTYFKRIFETPGGRKVFGDLERQADEKDRVIARRREFVAKIAEARRVDREDVPRLEALVAPADAELAAARESLRRARVRREDVGRAAHGLHMRCYDEIRRAEAELRRTSDPRLSDAHEILIEASAKWHHAYNELARRELHGEFMNAHYVITNHEELEGLKSRVAASLRAVDALRLQPDPAEDEIVAVIAEANAASRPILACVARFFS